MVNNRDGWGVQARVDQMSQKTVGVSLLKKRLLSGGAWALGGRMLIAFTGLAISALLGRLLTPEDLGVFFLAFSVVSLCSVLSSLGLETAVVRFVAENLGLGRSGRARSAVSKITALGALGTVGVGIAYLLFGSPLIASLFRAPTLSTVAWFMAAWILVLTFQNLLAETFRGFHDIRLATIFSRSTAGFGSLVAAILITAGLALLWLFEGRASLMTIMLLAVGSGLASTLLAGWLLRAKVRRLPSSENPESSMTFGEVLSVAWPLLLTNLTLFVLTQADIWIVGAFRPETEVALYGAATRLVTLVIIPLLIVNAVLPPLIAENYARGRTDDLQKVLRVTATLAGIPAFLVLLSFVFVGGPILGLVFGGYYEEGAILLTALSLGQLVSVWTGSCGVTMAMTGHQKVMMIITVFSSGIVVAAGLLSVNYYGVVGVAVTAAAGLALQNISMWLGVRFATGMWTHVALGSLPNMIKALRAG